MNRGLGTSRPHKKGATLFSTITLIFCDGVFFGNFFVHWKQQQILYKGEKIYNFALRMSPHCLIKQKQHKK